MSADSIPAVQEPALVSWPHTTSEATPASTDPRPDGDDSAAAADITTPEQSKPLEKKLAHTLVLDSGPIIKNVPTVTYLLENSYRLVTIPEVIAELRDEATRARIQTHLLPFLEIRAPRPESVKAIIDFSRRTGDLSVLSKPDVRVLALAYEIEVERNGGDWRLRSVPGQKGLNGKPPAKKDAESPEKGHGGATENATEGVQILQTEAAGVEQLEDDEGVSRVVDAFAKAEISQEVDQEEAHVPQQGVRVPEDIISGAPEPIVESVDSSKMIEEAARAKEQSHPLTAKVVEEDDDDEGWITHTNIKQHQAKDTPALVASTPLERTMQCATLTTDFAMQNVLLQMNLNLLSPQLQRIRHLKTFILRCHACFFQCKDTSKQFCPRCGQPTLTRVSCSTNASGEFQIHLKKNMQWNNRGNKFSLPKPTTGSASGRVTAGGGTGGWGQGLILAEDQKEYISQMSRMKRAKEKDLMNEDHLPDILTGSRSRDVSRPKIGAGRNVNARRRKK